MNNQANKHVQRVSACRRWLLKNFGQAPDIAIITGSSGPNALEDLLTDSIDKKLPSDIFPVPSVAGHFGRVRVGVINGVRVAWFRGRVHANEDPNDPYRTSTVVRALALWGVSNLIMTNAAGALNPGYKPGAVVIVDDHITLFTGPGPLTGDPQSLQLFGKRFLDVAEVYDRKLQMIAWREANKIKGLQVERDGVYVALFGPRFETRAEIRLLREFADLAGMSSIHEAEAAYQAEMRVLLLSMVTNPTFGKRPKKGEKISHEKNLQQTLKLNKSFAKLIGRIIRRIGKEA